MKINFKIVLIIVISSSILGLIYNSFSGKSIPLLREKHQLEHANGSDLNNSLERSDLLNKAIKAVDLEQTYKLYNSEKVKFIDARDQWDFSEGHIKDAINIQEFDFEPHQVADFDKSLTYIIYCGGDDCEVSERLAVELQKLGFQNLYVFTGGWTEWKNAGYPSAKEEMK